MAPRQATYGETPPPSSGCDSSQFVVSILQLRKPLWLPLPALGPPGGVGMNVCAEIDP